MKLYRIIYRFILIISSVVDSIGQFFVDQFHIFRASFVHYTNKIYPATILQSLLQNNPRSKDAFRAGMKKYGFDRTWQNKPFTSCVSVFI